MQPLPKPFRAQGQQIADDGNDKAFCDLWERSQVQVIQRQAYEDGLRDAADIVRFAVDTLRLPEVGTFIGDERPIVRRTALGIVDKLDDMLKASQEGK